MQESEIRQSSSGKGFTAFHSKSAGSLLFSIAHTPRRSLQNLDCLTPGVSLRFWVRQEGSTPGQDR